MQDVLGEARSYWRSRVILTAAELDVFTELDREPAGAPELARRLGSDPRATRRLLDCLVAFGLLVERGERYHATDDGARLSSRHPDGLRPMLLHLGHLWGNWSGLTQVVRTGSNPHRCSVTADRERLENFAGAMQFVSREASPRIAAALDLERFARLLDVGGGPGSYTIAALERWPRLRAVLFDLPAVAQVAARRFREAGLADRATTVAGDFERDELPGGCDAALLSAIIHQNDAPRNVALYRKIHRALAPGGALFIRDHVMEEDRSRPASGALFALNMLVSTDAGDTFTFREIERDLREAGFAEVRLLRSGEAMDGLVEALKPS